MPDRPISRLAVIEVLANNGAPKAVLDAIDALPTFGRANKATALLDSVLIEYRGEFSSLKPAYKPNWRLHADGIITRSYIKFRMRYYTTSEISEAIDLAIEQDKLTIVEVEEMTKLYGIGYVGLSIN